jgi:hypothetical protein
MPRFALLVAALSLFGSCGAEEKKEPAGTANVVLYVSNQSFEQSSVDIAIELDGRVAVDGDFAVEDQHNWVEYRLELTPGRHTLSATSDAGGASLTRSFVVRGSTWAVVNYWCCDDRPHFTFDVSRTPVAFA